MDQVDQVLDRLAAEIDVRDRLIAELSAARGGTEPNPYVAFGESAQETAPGHTLTEAPPGTEQPDQGTQPGGYQEGTRRTVPARRPGRPVALRGIRRARGRRRIRAVQCPAKVGFSLARNDSTAFSWAQVSAHRVWSVASRSSVSGSECVCPNATACLIAA